MKTTSCKLLVSILPAVRGLSHLFYLSKFFYKNNILKAQMGVWGWMLSDIAREIKISINVIANQEPPRLLVTFALKSDINGSAIGLRG